jgi:hypothetical protein
MATVGHWNKDGSLFEEYLFWDNGEFMKQIGLAQQRSTGVMAPRLLPALGADGGGTFHGSERRRSSSP